jgi:hypothetical protein
VAQLFSLGILTTKNMKTRILLITSLAVVVLVCAVSMVARGFCPQSMAFHRPVADGSIVILKQGSTVGAFILENQTQSPELTDYRWFLRSDGKTTFDPKDSAVLTGVVRSASDIKFGPFKVEWSTAGNGLGYVYYPIDYISVFHHVIQTRGSFEMAIPSARDIKDIDASSEKLAFRRIP